MTKLYAVHRTDKDSPAHLVREGEERALCGAKTPYQKWGPVEVPDCQRCEVLAKVFGPLAGWSTSSGRDAGERGS